MNNEILFNEFQDYVLKNISISFSKEMREKFKIYFNELIEWNKMFNLISFKNEKDLIYRHFCDSLYAVKVIYDILKTNCLGKKIVDLGTGSGMPGIPIKIVFPSIKLTLIESITKKCKFLENVNDKLGFDMEILNKRAEKTGQNPIYRQKYDFALSRAVSKLSPNMEIAIPLLKVGGYFITHKTKNSIQSLKDGLPCVKNAIRHLGVKPGGIAFYNLPGQKLDYCILTFKKHKNTLAVFPRKAGVPEKKPL